jgi:hypothetical protein
MAETRVFNIRHVLDESTPDCHPSLSFPKEMSLEFDPPLPAVQWERRTTDELLILRPKVTATAPAMALQRIVASLADTPPSVTFVYVLIMRKLAAIALRPDAPPFIPDALRRIFDTPPLQIVHPHFQPPFPTVPFPEKLEDLQAATTHAELREYRWRTLASLEFEFKKLRADVSQFDIFEAKFTSSTKVEDGSA